ncbi:hypothetical protein QBC35DRAFT_473040 [Podospora australis]|uniref:Uncharacterized protein n=1 Tax=Podospora australis TaxID=1536484 RepID=A0AAN6WVP5_9PEZI|nr:hypothetical protein QBC35DRAFT_473040 [Podospora australis]
MTSNPPQTRSSWPWGRSGRRNSESSLPSLKELFSGKRRTSLSTSDVRDAETLRRDVADLVASKNGRTEKKSAISVPVSDKEKSSTSKGESPAKGGEDGKTAKNNNRRSTTIQSR